MVGLGQDSNLLPTEIRTWQPLHYGVSTERAEIWKFFFLPFLFLLLVGICVYIHFTHFNRVVCRRIYKKTNTHRAYHGIPIFEFRVSRPRINSDHRLLKSKIISGKIGEKKKAEKLSSLQRSCRPSVVQWRRRISVRLTENTPAGLSPAQGSGIFIRLIDWYFLHLSPSSSLALSLQFRVDPGEAERLAEFRTLLLSRKNAVVRCSRIPKLNPKSHIFQNELLNEECVVYNSIISIDELPYGNMYVHILSKTATVMWTVRTLDSLFLLVPNGWINKCSLMTLMIRSFREFRSNYA